MQRYPTTACTATNGVPGIQSSAYLVTVRDGIVAGMAGSGVVLLGASSEIHRVRALSCGADGLTVGSAGRITDSFAGSNWGSGIFVGDGGKVQDNESRANRLNGVFVGGLRLVATIVENRIFDNGGFGAASGSAFQPIASKNFLAANASGAFSLIVSLGDNLCVHAGC